MSESFNSTTATSLQDTAATPSPKRVLDVAAGLILRADGSLLLAQRPGDKPWSGWWELPGGKIETCETVLEALARELKEELDIEITAATPWVTYVHEYPKNIVRLAFCRVTGWHGTPTGVEGQTLAWVDPGQPLPVGPLLPATEPPLRWLLLPDHYLLTSIGNQANLASFLKKLTLALQSGVKLVQFREPDWSAQAGALEVYAAFKQVLQCCREHKAQCLVNSVHPEAWWTEADGVHYRASDAAALKPGATPEIRQVPETPDVTEAPQTPVHPVTPRRLTGVSAHNAEDLVRAQLMKADFAVLGHVLETPSHPGQRALGWAEFARLSRDAGLPVFAIGGQSASTLNEARQHGAHGIAGIRHLLAGT
ncbi:MAG TPA: thiamine phosphate synthase [Eoetvoesiella sp.]